MSAIEKCIREAVAKGGWRPTLLSLPHLHNVHCNAEHFLDPLFWQALGKARGWGEEKRVVAEWNGNTGHIGAQFYTDAEYVWHRFIDHLAEGEDAESFFADLIK